MDLHIGSGRGSEWYFVSLMRFEEDGLRVDWMIE